MTRRAPRSGAAIGALAVAAAAVIAGACGRSHGTDGSGASGPAGKVVEVSGQVTAARAGADGRPLTQGQAVYADDTVATGAQASVTILIDHNHARWTLTANQSARVDRSLAWRAPAGSSSGSAFDDVERLPTASAGRHSAQEAAQTQGTSIPPSASAADEAPAAPAPATQPAPQDKQRIARRSSSHRSANQRERTANQGKAVDSLGSASALVGGDGAESREAARAERVQVQKPGGGAAAAAPAKTRAAPTVILRRLSVHGPRKKAAASRALRAALPALRACAGPAGDHHGQVVLHLTVDQSGRVSAARVTGPDPLAGLVSACLVQAARSIHLDNAASGPTQVDQTLSFK